MKNKEIFYSSDELGGWSPNLKEEEESKGKKGKGERKTFHRYASSFSNLSSRFLDIDPQIPMDPSKLE